MSIIIHPEFLKLKKELSDLIYELEELQNQICPNIEQEYILKFGFLEYELYKKDLKLNKLKRKLQLIQIQINNEDLIDLELIKKILNDEFEEYENNLKKQMGELENMMCMGRIVLSKKEAKQLKELYRQCVFKLHPDLNPNLTHKDKELFMMMTEAFKNGDLELLKVLSYSILNKEMESDHSLYDLKELIKKTKDKIMKVKENYPYNKKDLLQDPEKIEEYKYYLNNLIKNYDDEIERYMLKIAKLI